MRRDKGWACIDQPHEYSGQEIFYRPQSKNNPAVRYSSSKDPRCGKNKYSCPTSNFYIVEELITSKSPIIMNYAWKSPYINDLGCVPNRGMVGQGGGYPDDAKRKHTCKGLCNTFTILFSHTNALPMHNFYNFQKDILRCIPYMKGWGPVWGKDEKGKDKLVDKRYDKAAPTFGSKWTGCSDGVGENCTIKNALAADEDSVAYIAPLSLATFFDLTKLKSTWSKNIAALSHDPDNINKITDFVSSKSFGKTNPYKLKTYTTIKRSKCFQ